MAGAAIAVVSQIPLILSLIEAGSAAVTGLIRVVDKVHRGEELTEEDRNLLKRELAANKARFDAAVAAATGVQTPEDPGIPDEGGDAPPLPTEEQPPAADEAGGGQ